MNHTFFLYRGSEIFTGTYTNLIHMKESIYYIYELHLKYYIHCNVAKLSTPPLLRTLTVKKV